MDCCEGIFNCVCKVGFYFAALEKYEELEELEQAGEATLLPAAAAR